MESDDTNIVLFDPAVVEILQSSLVRVTRAEVEEENVWFLAVEGILSAQLLGH